MLCFNSAKNKIFFVMHLNQVGSTLINLSSASISQSSQMFSSTAGQMSRQQTETKPFSQQFNYHLQDLDIVRTHKPLMPEGKIKIRLPDITSFEIEFNRRETVETIKERIQPLLKFDVNKYYLVCRNGTIQDGATLDTYYITPGANILLIRKGIKDLQVRNNRRFWLNSREKRLRGLTPNQPATRASTVIAKPNLIRNSQKGQL